MTPSGFTLIVDGLFFSEGLHCSCIDPVKNKQKKLKCLAVERPFTVN